MWDHSTPIHVICGNTTTILACQITTCIDWKPVHKSSVTAWMYPTLQCMGFTDSWQWNSPVPRKHIGTRPLRFYFSVKELDRMRKNGGKFSLRRLLISNAGEFQLSTTCIGLHFCNLTWEWEFKCTWIFLTFLNKICYQVKIMWKFFLLYWVSLRHVKSEFGGVYYV